MKRKLKHWARGAFVRPAMWMFGVVLAGITAGAGGQTAAPVSVWSGVYTAAQNKRGEEIHASVCVMCHGPQLNGAGQPEMPPSPAIARASFLRKWSGRNVAALFLYVRQTMPPDAPGTLTDQQALDSIAHMFAVSNIPAGNSELPLDPKALANILIDAKP
jgi:cytochrome c